MKSILVLFATLAVLAVGGCKPKAADISPLQRKQAASLVSEAQFAMTMRDHARAEPLFAEAAKLCPDEGEYWLGLGVTRRRLGNVSGAKDAYEKARSAYSDAYALDPNRTDALLQEMYVLALLGRPDDATKRLEKAQKKDPSNARLKSFTEEKQIEKLLAEPSFKEISL